MSHITRRRVGIVDLNALDAACKQIGGLELIHGKTTFKAWGRSGNKCEHAVRVIGNSKAYEVGLIKSEDAKKAYDLAFDSFEGGYGLIEKIGDNAKTLTNEYTMQVAAKKFKQQGYNVVRSINPVNGKPLLRARQRV